MIQEMSQEQFAHLAVSMTIISVKRAQNGGVQGGIMMGRLKNDECYEEATRIVGMLDGGRRASE
jgi:hypothetical protein